MYSNNPKTKPKSYTSKKHTVQWLKQRFTYEYKQKFEASAKEKYWNYIKNKRAHDISVKGKGKRIAQKTSDEARQQIAKYRKQIGDVYNIDTNFKVKIERTDESSLKLKKVTIEGLEQLPVDRQITYLRRELKILKGTYEKETQDRFINNYTKALQHAGAKSSLIEKFQDIAYKYAKNGIDFTALTAILPQINAYYPGDEVAYKEQLIDEALSMLNTDLNDLNLLADVERYNKKKFTKSLIKQGEKQQEILDNKLNTIYVLNKNTSDGTDATKSKSIYRKK